MRQGRCKNYMNGVGRSKLRFNSDGGARRTYHLSFISFTRISYIGAVTIWYLPSRQEQTFSDFHSAQRQCYVSHSGSLLYYQLSIVSYQLHRPASVLCQSLRITSIVSIQRTRCHFIASTHSMALYILLHQSYNVALQLHKNSRVSL